MNFGSIMTSMSSAAAGQDAKVPQDAIVFCEEPQDLRVSVHDVEEKVCWQELPASQGSAGLLSEDREKLCATHSIALGCTVLCNDKKQAKYEAAAHQDARELTHIQELLLKLPVLDAWFNVVRKVGEGTFSTVYLATLKHVPEGDTLARQEFAIKHLVPTCLPSRTEKELKCMQEIGGKDNVVSVDLCLRSGDCIVFVMPYLPHTKFSSYVLDLDVSEVRSYMKNLMLALRRVHSFNVIHRDIKPSNFLYDRLNNRFLLVDFGLAQCLNSDGSRKPCVAQTPVPNTPKKRKRTDEEHNESDTATPGQHVVKRLALQPRTSDCNIPDGKRVLSRPSTVSYKSPPAKAVLPFDTENTPPRKQKTPGRKTPSTFKSPLKVHRDGRSSIKKKLFGTGSKAPDGPSLRQAFRSALSQNACNIRNVSFQTLTDKPKLGASYIRVQNSQVKSHQPGAAPSKPQHPFQFSKAPPQPKDGQCSCYGRPMICSACRNKKPFNAPRAGTPGFRPPEVLLKCHRQTTAVDMWGAGVILLCILSGCYPFFRAPDDLTALAEIITIFGSERVKQVARKLGRRIQCSQEKKPLDVRKLCERLRRHCLGSEAPRDGLTCSDCKQTLQSDGCVCMGTGSNASSCGTTFPDTAYNLMLRLLDCDPETRISAAEALQHPFIADL